MMRQSAHDLHTVFSIPQTSHVLTLKPVFAGNPIQYLSASTWWLFDLKSFGMDMHEMYFPDQFVCQQGREALKVFLKQFDTGPESGELQLAGLNLYTFPVDISRLSKLTLVKMSSNNISNVAYEIGMLEKLRELDLSSNVILSIPESVKHLTSLQRLSLRNNHLNIAPPNLRFALSLTDLDLSENQLLGVPALVFLLDELIILNVDHNKIPSLVDDFMHLKKLRHLQMNWNKVEKLTLVFLRLTELVTLQLHGNPLIALPNLQKTHSALIDYRVGCGSLPEAVRTCPSVKRYHLCPPMRLAMKGDAAVIPYLQTLEDSFVSNHAKLANKGTCEFPMDVFFNSGLTDLQLSKNSIKVIPVRLLELYRLRALDMSQNLIEELPNELCFIESLRQLVFDDNKIRFLPTDLPRLRNLRELP